MQAQFLVHLRGDFGIINRGWKHVGHVQDFEGGYAHFDFAGGDFEVVGARRAVADFPGDANDAFTAERGGAVEQVLGQVRGIEDGLGAAFAVADVNEDEAAEVAAGMDPAGQSDCLPDVGRAQFVAVMRTFHEIIMPQRFAGSEFQVSSSTSARASTHGHMEV